MDPRRAVVLLGLLLLLLTDQGQAEGPGDLDGDQDLAVSERPSSRSLPSSAWAQPCARGPQPPEATLAPGSGAQGTVCLPSPMPLCRRKRTAAQGQHGTPSPPGPSCTPCSRPWRDLAGAQPSCSSPRGLAETPRGRGASNG